MNTVANVTTVKASGVDRRVWSPTRLVSSRRPSHDSAVMKWADSSATASRSVAGEGKLSGGVVDDKGSSVASLQPSDSASNVECDLPTDPMARVREMYAMVEGFRNMGFSVDQVLEIISAANGGELDGDSGVSVPYSASTVSSSKYRSELRRADFESRAAQLAQQDGFCYLLLFRFSKRRPASEIYGRNPTLSRLLDAPVGWFAFRLWNKLVLTRDGLRCHLADVDSPGQTFAQAVMASAKAFGNVIPASWRLKGVDAVGEPLPVTAVIGSDAFWERPSTRSLSRADKECVDALESAGALSPLVNTCASDSIVLRNYGPNYYTVYLFSDFVEETTKALSYVCYDLDRTRVVCLPPGFERHCVVVAAYEPVKFVRMHVGPDDFAAVLAVLRRQGFYKGMYVANALQRILARVCPDSSVWGAANLDSHDAYAYALLYDDYRQRKTVMRGLGPNPACELVQADFMARGFTTRLAERGAVAAVMLGDKTSAGHSVPGRVLHGVVDCCPHVDRFATVGALLAVGGARVLY